MSKAIGAVLGVIALHYAWAFVVWDWSPWSDLDAWDAPGRAGFLYILLVCAFLGGLAGDLLLKIRR